MATLLVVMSVGLIVIGYGFGVMLAIIDFRTTHTAQLVNWAALRAIGGIAGGFGFLQLIRFIPSRFLWPHIPAWVPERAISASIDVTIVVATLIGLVIGVLHANARLDRERNNQAA